jgi:DNA-binding response OmpR family regulator
MLNKVLVFESDPAFAGELRTEFGNLGCATTVVDDGNVGLQKAAADRPDLILLSIELPRMNGFSVCNKLKKDANLKDVPLIIMSSESSDETFDQHKKLRTRAEDYIHKPIAFGELLRHIRQFVSLGSNRPPPEGGIVIDDEIEVASADYLIDDELVSDDESVDETAASGVAASASSAKEDSIYADVEAESAFGRLTEMGTASFQRESNGASTAVNRAVASRSSAPPVSLSPSQIPAALDTDAARVQLIEQELSGARGRLEAVERELDEARRELGRFRMEAEDSARLSREIDELRAKLASAARTGGTSSRDFLDLREALNKKDKEVLALKEQLSKKDKEIVEARDRSLSLERSVADVEDRLLGVERTLAAATEKNDSLAAECDAANMANQELASRLERTKAEAENREKQIAELRGKQLDERAAYEMKVAAMRGEIDELVAKERTEYARAIDEAEQRRVADLEHAGRERDAALTEARARADQEREELQSRSASEVKAIEQARDAQIASLEADAARQFDEARARIGEVEAMVVAVRDEREDLNRRLSVAVAKRDADRRSLERAKDALAVALEQIEETERSSS